MNDIPLSIITCSQLFKIVYVLCNFNKMKKEQFENEKGRLNS